MKTFPFFFILISCFAVSAFFVSCKKDPTNVQPDLNRSDLINNIADNIIIPNYQAFSNLTDSLHIAVVSFNTDPSTKTLKELQQKFKNAYLSYQRCAAFGFGPAAQVILDKNVNIFPTNVSAINANIAAGTYNLDELTNLDAKGFPALDYLLFGIGVDNSNIIASYTSADNAAANKQYLLDVTTNIQTLANGILNSWVSTGGNYIATFKSATGTDVGSALGQIVNGIDYDLDNLKNYEIAIPVGIMPSSGSQIGTPLPNEVQAYYSGISSSLLLTELTTLQNIYLGKSYQVDSAGLDDYLVKLNAQYNGGTLHDAINLQFKTAIAKVKALADPLSQTIANNPDAVKATYTELQKLLVLLKSDMPSAMGVLITFDDTDGD